MNKATQTQSERWLKAYWYAVYFCAQFVAMLFYPVSRVHAQDCDSNMLLLSHQGDYVSIPNSSPLQLQGGFTMECWAIATASPGSGSLIQKALDGGRISYELGLDSLSRLFVAFRGVSGMDSLFSQPITTLRNWHHYAAVFRPNDSIYLYMDGVEVASVMTPEYALTFQNDSLRIGMSVTPTHVTFIGAIDEVGIWNIPRSHTEILDQFSHTIARDSIDTVGLVAYYSFDDDPVIPYIHDFKFVNNGILRGSAAIVPGTAPITGPWLHGFKIRSVEQRLNLDTLFCTNTFDTIIHLYNPSPTKITVGSLGVSNGTAFNVTSSGGFDLLPDSSSVQSVRIQFSPQTTGTFYDTLIASSSSICGGTVHIPLAGVFAEPQLGSNSPTINFGSLAGCNLPAERTVTLTNSGNIGMNIYQANVDPAGDFVVISPSLPFHIGSGQSIPVTLQLTPGPDGPILASIRFVADRCFQSRSINVFGERKSLGLAIPAALDLPSRVATLNNIIIDSTIVIQNTGTLTFFLQNVTVQGAGFSLLKTPTKFAFNPGDTSALTIRFKGTDCGDFPGQLRLHISQPCPFDTIIPLAIHIAEPTLAANAQSFVLGNTCNTLDTVVTLTNTSDQTVLLRAVSFGGAPAFSVPTGVLPDSLAPQQSLQLPIHFAPEHAGTYNSTAIVTMLPCGGATFDLSASAGLRNVTVSDTLLGFGRGCDFTSRTRGVTVTNRSNTDFTIGSARFVGSTRYSLTNLSLPVTVHSGESLPISVQYTPIALPEKDDALLTLLTTDGCLVNAIHLVGSRELPSLAWSEVLGDFGTVCPGDTGALTILLVNNGLDTVDVGEATVTDSLNFQLRNYTKHIPAGDSGVFLIQFTPTALDTVHGLLQIFSAPCSAPYFMQLFGIGGPPPKLIASDTVLNFGKIRAKDSAALCVTFSNPSCIPILLDSNSFALPAPFRFVVTPKFPLTVQQGSAQTVCIVYSPKTIDSSSVALTVRGSDSTSSVLHLLGIGLQPSIRLLDSVLDFGYVIIGTSPSLTARIANVGNDTTSLSISGPNTPVFSVGAFNPIDSGNSKRNLDITFAPTQLGRVNDTILVQSNGFTSRIFLRGEGVTDGLTENVLELNFGDVLVGASSTDSMKFTATKGLPITINQPSALPPFVSTFSATSNNPITSDRDTATLLVRFLPTAEIAYRDTLSIQNTSSHIPTVVLTGRGVNPHAELTPSDTLDFGKVQLGTSVPKPLLIADTGGYQLQLLSITSDSTEFSVQSIGQTLIAAGTSQSQIITFTPLAAKPIESFLRIQSSSVKPTTPILLKGRGTYGPANEPDVSFGVSNENLRTGERVQIPVILRASQPITLDSLRVDFIYDPFAVFIHGISSASTLTEGLSPTVLRYGDSIISIQLKGVRRTYSEGIIFNIDAEALLTTHDTSHIAVLESNPDNTLTSQSSADGLFIVSDCGNQAGDVAVMGNTSVSAPEPNPATESTELKYNLGIAGHTSLKLYDPLGRIAKTFFDEDETVGPHTVSLHLTDIPSGHYIYELQTPVVSRRGVLVITH